MLRILARIEETIAKILLAVMVILVFIAAIMRWFGHPLIWSIDLAQLLFIWLCFFGATQALRNGEHIGVDLFIRRLPQRVIVLIEIALSVIIAAFLIILVYSGFDLTWLNWERRLGDSNLSYAFVTVAVPIGSILLLSVLISRVRRAIKGLEGPEERRVFTEKKAIDEIHEGL